MQAIDVDLQHMESALAARSAIKQRKFTDREAPGNVPGFLLVRAELFNVRFSNRPFEVKHFQTIHHCSVDVAHGLALLFGIGTKALPLWDSRTRRNNLWVGVAVTPTVGPSGHTNSPHPSSREGHLSTAWWNSSILLL